MNICVKQIAKKKNGWQGSVIIIGCWLDGGRLANLLDWRKVCCCFHQN